jgi:hypothetical protein
MQCYSFPYSPISPISRIYEQHMTHDTWCWCSHAHTTYDMRRRSREQGPISRPMHTYIINYIHTYIHIYSVESELYFYFGAASSAVFFYLTVELTSEHTSARTAHFALCTMFYTMHYALRTMHYARCYMP